jgi:hypothetical protein
MGKKLIVSCLFLISFINSYGQWYVKQYNVTDINFLSKDQLEVSLFDSKNYLLYSGCVVVLGGLVILAGESTLHHGLDENPSIIEFLLGSEFMGNTYIVIGAGLLVGGTIASIAYIDRIGRIKSVINKNYPSVGSLNISPTIILNSYTRSYFPGFTLIYNF